MPRRITISGRAGKIRNQLRDLDLLRVMNRTVAAVRDKLKQQHMGGSNTSPNRLARNTGAMERNTVATRAEKVGESIRASVKVNVPYASVHFTDRGYKQTIIRPKNVTKLTVPILKNEQKRPPLPASGYRQKFAYNNILYAVRNGKFVFPIFALRSSVRVPARIDISRDINPYAKAVFDQEFQSELKTFMK